MGRPSASDPLGQRPDPASFADAMETMIDARINQRLLGITTQKLDGVTDLDMVHELLARGWAVFRPTTSQGKS